MEIKHFHISMIFTFHISFLASVPGNRGIDLLGAAHLKINSQRQCWLMVYSVALCEVESCRGVLSSSRHITYDIPTRRFAYYAICLLGAYYEICLVRFPNNELGNLISFCLPQLFHLAVPLASSSLSDWNNFIFLL